MKKEDKYVVIKVTIDSSEVKMKLLDFMNFQFMQFNSQVLGNVLK